MKKLLFLLLIFTSFLGAEENPIVSKCLEVLKRLGYGFATPKIYDCFTFFNELDVLEIRLNELYDYVDYFVLVESTETHQGQPKPLYYEQNKDRFKRFQDKIIHVIVENRIPLTWVWAIENYQRNQIFRGLYKCISNDIVIISDVDEIPRGKTLSQISNMLTAEQPMIACTQDLFSRFLNSYVGQWNGSVVTSFFEICSHSPQGIRNMRNNIHSVPNAGWHFTSIGDQENYRKKIQSVVPHQSGNEIRLSSDESVKRSFAEFAKYCIPIDSLFPQHIIEHFSEYVEKGFIREHCPSSREKIGFRLNL